MGAKNRLGKGQNRKLRSDYARDKTANRTPQERRDIAGRNGSSKNVNAKSARRGKGATMTTKNRKGSNAGRKLAADHGRGRQKSGGEPKKDRETPRGEAARNGSAKQRKG